MAFRSCILACALVAASALAGPAGATGFAIQDLRSTQGLRTNGLTASDTGGTGIYTKEQRRAFGYGAPRGRVAPSR